MRSAIVITALIGACVGPKEPDRTAPVPFVGHGFRATLRRDIASNMLAPAPGVTLYDFHVGSLPLLFMYVGDKPGYPHFGWTPEHEEDSVLASGSSAHCRSVEVDDTTARECLIALSEHSPRKLHVWYERLDPAWARVADAVIASLVAGTP